MARVSFMITPHYTTSQVEETVFSGELEPFFSERGLQGWFQVA
jgi:hypothetical protein